MQNHLESKKRKIWPSICFLVWRLLLFLWPIDYQHNFILIHHLYKKFSCTVLISCSQHHSTLSLRWMTSSSTCWWAAHCQRCGRPCASSCGCYASFPHPPPPPLCSLRDSLCCSCCTTLASLSGSPPPAPEAPHKSKRWQGFCAFWRSFEVWGKCSAILKVLKFCEKWIIQLRSLKVWEKLSTSFKVMKVCGKWIIQLRSLKVWEKFSAVFKVLKFCEKWIIQLRSLKVWEKLSTSFMALKVSEKWIIQLRSMNVCIFWLLSSNWKVNK